MEIINIFSNMFSEGLEKFLSKESASLYNDYKHV